MEEKSTIGLSLPTVLLFLELVTDDRIRKVEPFSRERYIETVA